MSSQITAAPELRQRLAVVKPLAVETAVTEGTVNAKKLTKLLLNVTIECSLVPVHLVMAPENTVSDLVKAAVDVYVKDCRRPLLATTDPEAFELHYSQYSLESLDSEEKLMNLGSRNFFMCVKRAATSVDPKARQDMKLLTPSFDSLPNLDFNFI